MKVLVADDSLVMRRLLESTLESWNYEVISVRDGGEAWAHLEREDAPPLAILDWMMPVATGLELCRKVRAMNRLSYTYILLLTSRGLREDIVEGMSAGADDYVVKPFDKHELEVRLRAGRRIIDLQADLVSAREALREQATRDALTSVWNRSSILEILDRELHRSRREGRSVGLVMMDLDNFKEINDTYGHQDGDEALREVGRRMTRAIRPYDSFGRYGGEEFMCVVPSCNESGLRSHAERLRLALCETPMTLSGYSIGVTASFGITCPATSNPLTIDQLIRVADDALYEAKRAGRNRVVYLAAETSGRIA
jgi:diguanylate cyclase (GGDEF)-like protein